MTKMMGGLILFALLTAAPALQAADVQLEFRIAEPKAGPDLVETTIGASKKPIFLRKEVVMTNADVASAEVTTQGQRALVVLQLTPLGSAKLSDLTTKNIGRRLVVVIDGKPVFAPVITAAIPSGQIVINGLSKEEAERVAAGLASN